MKKPLFLLFLIVSFAAVSQQQLPISVISTIEVAKADTFVGVDPYGYAYLIADNALIKSKGLRDAAFQDPSLGKISRVDLTNPLQIVLFYQTFNTVVLLDSQLNEIMRIDFNRFESSENALSVQAVGLASQNRLWIYDALTQKIGLFDLTKKHVQFLTVPLDQPSGYQTNYNHFIWRDANGMAFSADVFGKITPLGKTPDSPQVQFLENGKILIVKDGRITIVDTVSGSSNPLEIAEKTFDGFYYNDQILSIFTKHGITNYKITLP